MNDYSVKTKWVAAHKASDFLVNWTNFIKIKVQIDRQYNNKKKTLTSKNLYLFILY